MSFTFVVIAILWGLLAGYLLLRGADSLLGLLFCVHAVFERRWKTLVDKNATGLVRPRLILKLALRLAVYALLCGFILDAGNSFLVRTYQFTYEGLSAALFAVSGGCVIISRLRISWQRMKLVWRISHEFDFAARRERTRLLKS